MKAKSFYYSSRSLLVLLPLFAFVLGGCSSQKKDTGVMYQPALNSDTNSIAHLHASDTVIITLSLGAGTDEIPPMEKPIKDDGTITLPDIGRVQAAGKTPGELEDAIHDLYVPNIYLHLNVTVKASNDRVYYVKGEVKNPGRMIYAGTITVSKAITSAGDFTDFAKHSDITLIRANGNRYLLNIDDIISGEAPDPPVYPGDQIVVGRRIF